jgi:hypothetical protein
VHGLNFDNHKGRRLDVKRKLLAVSFTKKFILDLKLKGGSPVGFRYMKYSS